MKFFMFRTQFFMSSESNIGFHQHKVRYVDLLCFKLLIIFSVSETCRLQSIYTIFAVHSLRSLKDKSEHKNAIMPKHVIMRDLLFTIFLHSENYGKKNLIGKVIQFLPDGHKVTKCGWVWDHTNNQQ